MIVEVRTASPAHSEIVPKADSRAIVSEDAVIGANCTIAPYCVVRGRTRVGSHTTIDSFAVIGGDPQQSGFDPATSSSVAIGACVTIREGVTVHRSAVDGGCTIVDDEAYLMTNSHVGHDCKVCRGAVLGTNVMLAGHVLVGEHATLGGGAGVHQFVRIGPGAMVGGNASISYDVPPFTVATERNRLCGLNLVGLRRRHVAAEAIADLKECYRAVFAETGDLRQRARAVLANESCGRTPLGREFLEFFEGGTRGFVRDRRRRCRETKNPGRKTPPTP
ncbi:MAG: acyl-ACP--UDP-N-acetylglucosamine O-acyltransferase [Planctomycetota bacterium]